MHAHARKSRKRVRARFVPSARAYGSCARVRPRISMKKNYETYYRSARVQLSNKFWTILNYIELFSLGLFRSILVFLGQSWFFLVYLCISLPVFGYISLPQAISGYLGLSLVASLSIMVYLGLYWSILVYISLSQSISAYLGFSLVIPGYILLSWAIYGYTRVSRVIPGYILLCQEISSIFG